MKRIDENSGRCPGCKQVKLLTEFYTSRASLGGYCPYCIACEKRLHDAFYRKKSAVNRQYYRDASKAENRRLREDVIRAYGGECACCGESEYEFMSVDHINCGGIRHIRSLGLKTQQQFYRWLRQNSYPEGFRILCHNCNQSYGHYAYCPHEVARNRQKIAIVSC